MTNQESARQQRRHRSRAEADQLAAEYAASGLSRAEFSAQRDVCPKTLERYIVRHRKQQAACSESQPWVAVEVTGRRERGGAFAVLLSGGRRIEVQPGFDAATLRQLVVVLEQC